MRHAEIAALLASIAAEKAAFDGEPVGPVYLHAAANELSALVRQSLDNALNLPRAPAPASPETDVSADPEAQAATGVAPAPVVKPKRPAKTKIAA